MDHHDTSTGTDSQEAKNPMYDMYPEWGPAQHNPDNPRSHENISQAVQASLDLRDNGGQRPDDN